MSNWNLIDLSSNEIRTFVCQINLRNNTFMQLDELRAITVAVSQLSNCWWKKYCTLLQIGLHFVFNWNSISMEDTTPSIVFKFYSIFSNTCFTFLRYYHNDWQIYGIFFFFIIFDRLCRFWWFQFWNLFHFYFSIPDQLHEFWDIFWSL